MNITVNFLSGNPVGGVDYKQTYKIEIYIENEDALFDGGFIKFKNCVKPIIPINQLTNEDELEKLGIKYLKEKNEDKENLIPIGIVDFSENPSYKGRRLVISDISYDDLINVEQVIENIRKAISIKYKAKKLLDNCKQRNSIQFDLNSPIVL
ncbi:hypothetical protein ACJDU8_21595 [Clostridium sp. WILCCON 0269]|uniref:Uncharacterized protein n=1 Tax=Candidatus Clostridium eludens TaxID=3381663 RepID=A0ABW8SQX1_9CLOT